MSDKRNQSLFLEILRSLSDGQKLVGLILASGFVIACLLAIIAVGLLDPPVETVVEPTIEDPQPTPPEPPTGRVTIEIDYKKLIAKLEFEKTPYYVSYRNPTKELIQGQVGSYFYVDIFGDETQTKITFPTGKYILDKTEDADLGRGLGQF